MTEQDAVELLEKIAELEAERPLSLARLAKQSGRAMSTLMRDVAALEAIGLVQREGDIVRVIRQ